MVDDDKPVPDETKRRAISVGTVVATVTGNLVLVSSTIVLGIVGIVAAFIPPRGRWYHPVARLWARIVLLASGVRLRRQVEVAVDPERRYVFMANHQSLFDILVLIVSVPVQFRFLAKRSLFQIPIFGWSLRAAGFVSVDRERRDTAGKTFSSALDALREGDSLLVFPEETRSLDGRLREFQRGGFLMALKTGLAVVPVGIRGTLRVRPKGSLRISPGVVEVSFGPSREVTEYGLKRKSELIADVAGDIGRLAGVEGPPAG